MGKHALSCSWCPSWGQFSAANRTASRPESNGASIAYAPLVTPFGILRNLGERMSGEDSVSLASFTGWTEALAARGFQIAYKLLHLFLACLP